MPWIYNKSDSFGTCFLELASYNSFYLLLRRNNIMAKQNNKQRRNFLLTFFDEDNHSVKEVNGFILEKRWNGNLGNWEVAIFTKESYKNMTVNSLFN